MSGFPTRAVVGSTVHGTKFVFTRLGIHTDATVLATSTINGPAGTWTKTGVGEYTYTLDTTNSNYKVNGAGYRPTSTTASPGGQAQLTLIGAAAGTFGCEIKSEDYVTAGTLVVRIFTKSTGAAVDTSAAIQVNVAIALFDASVGSAT